MIKTALILASLVTVASTLPWMYLDSITLEYNQWTPASSTWHQFGLPNVCPVKRMVSGEEKPCTTVSWQYGNGGDVFSDDPYGLYLFKPSSMGEGAVYYMEPTGLGVECWTYPVSCDPPRYLVQISSATSELCMYQGYGDWGCDGIEVASLGTIKAMWGSK